MKPIESDETENLRVNLLTQEIKFAKMLAGNTFDGALKEKHIDKLSIWLKNRAACTEGIDKIDYNSLIYFFFVHVLSDTNFFVCSQQNSQTKIACGSGKVCFTACGCQISQYHRKI